MTDRTRLQQEAAEIQRQIRELRSSLSYTRYKRIHPADDPNDAFTAQQCEDWFRVFTLVVQAHEQLAIFLHPQDLEAEWPLQKLSSK
jgi:hypothetical protein